MGLVAPLQPLPELSDDEADIYGLLSLFIEKEISRLLRKGLCSCTAERVNVLHSVLPSLFSRDGITINVLPGHDTWGGLCFGSALYGHPFIVNEPIKEEQQDEQ